MKLYKIDELVLDNHYYLTPEDKCYYFHNYFPYKGPDGGTVFSLIHNFKKKLTKKGKPEWKYKLDAIEKIADLYRNHLSLKLPGNLATITQIPPSKSCNDPLYDDRMEQVLRIGWKDRSCDIRELFSVKESRTASHESNNDRPKPHELRNNLLLNEEAVTTTKNSIVLFDDVVTTGAHFRVCKDMILEKFPTKNVYGIFLARRAIEQQF